MTITQDATSLWYRPATSGEWTSLLSGSGINNPYAWWLCQEASGTLADSGSHGCNLEVVSGAPTYSNTVSGWSSKAVICRVGGADLIRTASGTWPDASTLVLALLNFPSGHSDGNPNNVITIGPTYAAQVSLNCKASTTPTRIRMAYHGDTMVDGANDTTGFHPAIVQADKTNTLALVRTDLETISHSNTNDTYNQIALGGNSINFWLATGTGCMYMAAWTGTDAEMSGTTMGTLLGLMQNGPAASGSYPRGRSTNLGGLGSGKSRGHFVNL